MKKLHKTLAATLVSISMLSTPGLAEDFHPETGVKLDEEQVFTYRALDESSSLDPQLVQDVDGSYIVRDLFEGLLNTDAEGNPEPGVAKRYESSDDNMTWTFYLRDDAKWSDGNPVTAHDFVYAWRRAVDPAVGSPYAWYMGLMGLKNGQAIIDKEKDKSELGVKAVDDHTLQVQLDEPKPYFPQMVTHATTFPSPKWVIEEHGDDWTRPGNLVGNGAFVLTEHVINERLVRERNELYWDNESNMLDKVEALVINNENQALNRYDAGEIDKTEVPAGQYPRQEERRPKEAHSNPSLCTYYYAANTEVPPLDDPRVRTALSLAIDRKIIVENVTQGGQQPAYSFTPDLTAGFNAPTTDYSELTQAERDKKARELLKEAGYDRDNPLETSILYNTDESHRKVAIAVSQMWKQKLGVKATLENKEWKTVLSDSKAGNFEITRSGWCGDYNEASTFLNLLTRGNALNYSNFDHDKYNELAEKARLMNNPTPNYTKMEKILANEMPILPIYFYTNAIMLKPYVKGWPHNDVQENVQSKNLYIADH
ncbi:peptide ABC transporter substrate-binding protein [Halomonadaceae bacterium KBTZ08]